MRFTLRQNAIEFGITGRWTRLLAAAGVAGVGLGLAAVHAAPPEGTKTATATAPASVQPAKKLASGKLGDFNSGEMKNAKTGVGWDVWKFAQGDKKPTAEAKIVDAGEKGQKALHFEGAVPEDAQFGFMGVGCAFGKDMTVLADMTAYKGLRFKVRGDENPYRLVFISDAVKDYNYHGKEFVAEKEWTTVTVPFADLKQVQGFGSVTPWTGKDIKSVSFSTPFQFTGPAWFEIADVELYK
jgi:hypothetical protein